MPTVQSMDGPNGINSICFDCGKKYGIRPLGSFGMWMGECDICGENIAVGNALHDFGMSEREVQEARMKQMGQE